MPQAIVVTSPCEEIGISRPAFARRKQPVAADYTGKTIDDLFIVGYGLDYSEHYRNLPYVGVLKSEIYS